MYIVMIGGDDPFIATRDQAIYSGLKEIHDGHVYGPIYTGKSTGTIKFTYRNNIGQYLDITAYKTEVYG